MTHCSCANCCLSATEGQSVCPSIGCSKIKFQPTVHADNRPVLVQISAELVSLPERSPEVPSEEVSTANSGMGSWAVSSSLPPRITIAMCTRSEEINVPKNSTSMDLC